MSEHQNFDPQESIVIDNLSSIFYFEFNDRFIDRLESHQAWEMVYIDRGECDIVADDLLFTLKQGEFYFHKPFERHMLQVRKGECPNVIIVSFLTSSPAMRFFEGRKLEASMSTKQFIVAIIHEAFNTYKGPFNAPQELIPKQNNGLWGGKQSILIRLELMLIELIREGMPKAMDHQSRMFYKKDIVTDPFCLKVIEYMEAHLREKISMDDLSRELSFSKSYISKRFVSTCGYSIIDYFIILKINEAKRMIRETDMNFFEVSELLGFSNSHYFSTMFKKVVGMTPTQYKRSCNQH